MKLYLKNLVNNRSKIIVKAELEKLGLTSVSIDFGEIETNGIVPDEKLELLAARLSKMGLSLLNDKKSILIEKIKNTIIELIHYSDFRLKINFSDYLGEKLNYDYTYLSNIFSESQGYTIEHFLIINKIERVKELLIYDELNVTEIAFKMHYSSPGHLSNQFRKMTGLTPSHYKQLKLNSHGPPENV